MTTGVEEREARQRVRKRARTRARTHSHAPTPLAHWGKHAGGRTSPTAHRSCAAQEPTAPLSMQGKRERRQTPAEARGRGRARAREPGELTRGASAELVRARKSFVTALVLAGNSTDAKGSEDRMTSPGANARSATTQPAPGAARRRNLEPLIEVPLARIVPPRRERPAVGRAPCAHRAAPPEQREQQGGRYRTAQRLQRAHSVALSWDPTAWCRGDTARALGSGAPCPSSAATPRAARR